MGEPLNIQHQKNHLFSTIESMASSAVCGHCRKLSWAPKEAKQVVTFLQGRAFEQILAFAKDRAKTTDMFVFPLLLLDFKIGKAVIGGSW